MFTDRLLNTLTLQHVDGTPLAECVRQTAGGGSGRHRSCDGDSLTPGTSHQLVIAIVIVSVSTACIDTCDVKYKMSFGFIL